MWALKLPVVLATMWLLFQTLDAAAQQPDMRKQAQEAIKLELLKKKVEKTLNDFSTPYLFKNARKQNAVDEYFIDGKTSEDTCKDISQLQTVFSEKNALITKFVEGKRFKTYLLWEKVKFKKRELKAKNIDFTNLQHQWELVTGDFSKSLAEIIYNKTSFSSPRIEKNKKDFFELSADIEKTILAMDSLYAAFIDAQKLAQEAYLDFGKKQAALAEQSTSTQPYHTSKKIFSENNATLAQEWELKIVDLKRDTLAAGELYRDRQKLVADLENQRKSLAESFAKKNAAYISLFDQVKKDELIAYELEQKAIHTDFIISAEVLKSFFAQQETLLKELDLAFKQNSDQLMQEMKKHPDKTDTNNVSLTKLQEKRTSVIDSYTEVQRQSQLNYFVGLEYLELVYDAQATCFKQFQEYKQMFLTQLEQDISALNAQQNTLIIQINTKKQQKFGLDSTLALWLDVQNAPRMRMESMNLWQEIEQWQQKNTHILLLLKNKQKCLDKAQEDKKLIGYVWSLLESYKMYLSYLRSFVSGEYTLNETKIEQLFLQQKMNAYNEKYQTLTNEYSQQKEKKYELEWKKQQKNLSWKDMQVVLVQLLDCEQQLANIALQQEELTRQITPVKSQINNLQKKIETISLSLSEIDAQLGGRMVRILLAKDHKNIQWNPFFNTDIVDPWNLQETKVLNIDHFAVAFASYFSSSALDDQFSSQTTVDDSLKNYFGDTCCFIDPIVHKDTSEPKKLLKVLQYVKWKILSKDNAKDCIIWTFLTAKDIPDIRDCRREDLLWLDTSHVTPKLEDVLLNTTSEILATTEITKTDGTKTDLANITTAKNKKNTVNEKTSSMWRLETIVRNVLEQKNKQDKYQDKQAKKEGLPSASVPLRVLKELFLLSHKNVSPKDVAELESLIKKIYKEQHGSLPSYDEEYILLKRVLKALEKTPVK